MTKIRLFSLSVAWISLLLMLPVQALAQDSEDDKPKIVSINIKGNVRTETQAIRNQLLQRPGMLLSTASVANDVRRIYSLGRFRDVTVSYYRKTGGVVLIYTVVEKPAILKIRLKGNSEVNKDDIKGVLDIKRFGILDRAQVQQNVKKIKDLYVEKGFYLATVTAEITKPVNASVIVTFVIRENAKIRIRQINFVGNKKVPSQILRKYIQTAEHSLIGWVSGQSTYQEALIARDVFFLESYYLNNGYVMAKVTPPKVYLNRSKRSIYITYSIQEGERYRYDKIKFQGDVKGFLPGLKLRSTLRKGEYFNRESLYRVNLKRFTTYYQNRGYAYVNVIPQHSLNHKKREISMTFRIQKGPRVKIERIEISGNTSTQDKVIRRELRVYEGDYYNGSRLRFSQQRVFALGFFAKTHPLYGVKVVSRRGSKPDRIILRFMVKEKATGTFQIGAGFSSVETIIFNAQISKNNLFGRGQSLSLAAQLSGIRQLFQLQFVEPYFLDTRVTFAFSGFNSQRDYRTLFSIGFIQTTTGGSVTFGYPLLDDLTALLTYKLERVQIDASGNSLESGIRLKGFFSGADGPTTTSSVRATLRYDKRNNRLFPSRGNFQSLSVEWAPELLGSQNRFTRYSLISRWYLSLPLSLVLRFNLNLGWITSPSARGVPAFERYRLGGINTIRGYRAFTIGPTRAIPAISDGAFGLDDFNWGGNKQLIFNMEIEFPIVQRVGIKGVLFFDAGNAYDNNEFFFQDKRNTSLPLGLYLSVGFGFRWFSPIGPLRFEWGIPLTPRAGDDPILFEFSIGNAF